MRRIVPALVMLGLLAPSIAASESKHTAKSSPAPDVLPLVITPAETPEAEPNDGPEQAQPLSCNATLRPAEIVNPEARRDTDWVAFDANAGELLTITTAPDPPRNELDTILGLIAEDGTTVLARDDDSGPGVYSAIVEFCAPYTGRYFAVVRGFRGAQGAYRLDIACTPGPGVPPNDQCAGAIEIGCGPVDLAGNSRCAVNDVSPGVAITDPASCTGSHALGRDVFFRIDVAEAGERIDVTYQITPAESDASIYLVSDCGDVLRTCLAGQDAPSGVPAERLAYRFPQAGIYYLVLDAFPQAGGAWTLEGLRDCTATPTRKLTWGRLKTFYR